MSQPTNPPARNTKVMNRFDLTSRLVAKLRNEEAVVGGIGNTNFDLWAAGHRPQNFYMLGSMGLAFPIALGVASDLGEQDANPSAPRATRADAHEARVASPRRSRRRGGRRWRRRACRSPACQPELRAAFARWRAGSRYR